MQEATHRIDLWQAIEIAACVIVLVILYAIIGCPIRFITGVSCAGCGMTRAWIRVLHLDMQGAFNYHPLFWLVPITVMLLWKGRRVNRRVYHIGIWSIVALFLVVYLYRMVTHDSGVVVFAPQDGLLLRVCIYLRGRI